MNATTTKIRPSVIMSRAEHDMYIPFGTEAMRLLERCTARWSIGGVRYVFDNVDDRDNFANALLDSGKCDAVRASMRAMWNDDRDAPR